MRNHAWPKSNLSGFTLMELSVAIAIFMILAGLVIVNLRYGNQVTKLKNAATELAQNIRLIQSYASSGKTFKICSDNSNPCERDSDCEPATCGEEAVPKGGFGLKFIDEPAEVNHYTLFIDPKGCKRFSMTGLTVSTINLPQDIVISELYLDDQITGFTAVDLLFQAPTAKAFLNAKCTNCIGVAAEYCVCDADDGLCPGGGVFINQEINSTEAKELKITLKNSAINKMRNIIVNRVSGKVSVE